MALPSIDIEKSINRTWLCLKFSWQTLFDYGLVYIAGSVLFVSIAIPFFTQGSLSLSFTIIVTLILGWTVLNLILLNKLYVITGKDIESNNKHIRIALKSIYDQINLDGTSTTMMRSVKSATTFWWGRVITVLFKDDKVYLNITTLGRGNGPTPFHGLYNYFVCWMASREFKRLQ